MTTELANRLPSPMFAGRRPRWVAMVLAFVVATTGAFLPRAAQAVDGCLVLLCFAAPSWRSIPRHSSPICRRFRPGWKSFVSTPAERTR